ncbi:carboxypeptidase regulatory-like domain-containing protein [Botryobacter ruber]|uniref:carboxypeptidase regulatory-like domain-containing protein n=1 Tax=Botryobacter ruber TaxID=2171629 RepID=UPI000E0C5064|nr:carboxypeptidase regulatory-like domain-containing protein [Botryobacter ruber]
MKEALVILLFFIAACNGSKQQPGHEQYSASDSATAQGMVKQDTSSEQAQDNQAPIQQGIKGKIYYESGNQMPSPDVPRTSNKRGVQRQVFIYELTNASQVTTTEGVFYSNIKTKQVAQVTTDANGNFSVSLKPGRYSIFTKEPKGLYANLFDGQNNIFPVEVKEGEVTEVEFLVNYDAVY